MGVHIPIARETNDDNNNKSFILSPSAPENTISLQNILYKYNILCIYIGDTQRGYKYF